MAAIEWELNLFSGDPRQLEPYGDADYERAARALASCATPTRLKLLHALLLGESTPMRASSWTNVPQHVAERELRAMVLDGLAVRETSAAGPVYRPVDGHLVALAAIAVAHGAHPDAERGRHPLLLRDRRRIAGTRVRDGK